MIGLLKSLFERDREKMTNVKIGLPNSILYSYDDNGNISEHIVDKVNITYEISLENGFQSDLYVIFNTKKTIISKERKEIYPFETEFENKKDLFFDTENLIFSFDEIITNTTFTKFYSKNDEQVVNFFFSKEEAIEDFNNKILQKMEELTNKIK